MKIKNFKHSNRYLYLILLLTACVILWFLTRGDVDQPITPQPPPVVTVGSGTKLPNPVHQQDADERAAKLKTMVTTSNVPIAFWGKVIDEKGAPLINVRITYRIQSAVLMGLTGIGPTKGGQNAISTGGAGLFSILHERGVMLDFEGFEKEGFTLMANQSKAFAYSRTPVIHVPDENSPKVFVMKSNSAPADVKNISGKFELLWDGTPLRINLETGQVSLSGKLIVTAFRSATIGQVRGFEWRLSLEIEGGGLQQESEKEAAFLAPENGYLDKWESGSTAEAKPWKGGYHGNIYFQLNGKYGRLKLRTYPDSRVGEVSFQIESFVNNSGGRNTE